MEVNRVGWCVYSDFGSAGGLDADRSQEEHKATLVKEAPARRDLGLLHTPPWRYAHLSAYREEGQCEATTRLLQKGMLGRTRWAVAFRPFKLFTPRRRQSQTGHLKCIYIYIYSSLYNFLHTHTHTHTHHSIYFLVIYMHISKLSFNEL